MRSEYLFLFAAIFRSAQIKPPTQEFFDTMKTWNQWGPDGRLMSPNHVSFPYFHLPAVVSKTHEDPQEILYSVNKVFNITASTATFHGPHFLPVVFSPGQNIDAECLLRSMAQKDAVAKLPGRRKRPAKRRFIRSLEDGWSKAQVAICLVPTVLVSRDVVKAHQFLDLYEKLEDISSIQAVWAIGASLPHLWSIDDPFSTSTLVSLAETLDRLEPSAMSSSNVLHFVHAERMQMVLTVLHQNKRRIFGTEYSLAGTTLALRGLPTRSGLCVNGLAWCFTETTLQVTDNALPMLIYILLWAVIFPIMFKPGRVLVGWMLLLAAQGSLKLEHVFIAICLERVVRYRKRQLVILCMVFMICTNLNFLDRLLWSRTRPLPCLPVLTGSAVATSVLAVTTWSIFTVPPVLIWRRWVSA